MNLKYNELNTVLPELPTGGALRSNILACAVGLAVANRLPLPTSQVADCAEHWNFQISGLVNAPVSDINESATFDAKAAVAFARSFWLLRYTAAYPGAQLSFAADSDRGFIDTLAGAALHIPEEMSCFVNEYKRPIFQLLLVVNRLMDTYNPFQTEELVG